MSELSELNNAQRRQFIDAQQAYVAWRDASRLFNHAYDGPYAGSMRWVTRNGVEYLYRKRLKTERSLGRRSPETEMTKEEYVRQRDRYRRREKMLRDRLNNMAPVNHAMGLDRVPRTAARILERLDKEHVLGRNLFVAGTHSLYAYEARAGVHLSSDIVATGDIDLVWDARRRLSLVSSEMRASGVVGLLRDVDGSFSTGATYGYSAVNNEGYYVDVICPAERGFMKRVTQNISEADDDIEPAPIEGLQWLISSPKFEEVAIGEGGTPVPISCVDPRVFALHKMWLSQRQDRPAIKRSRDRAQAQVAAELAVRYFALSFDATDLSALPESLRAMKSEVAPTS